MNKDYNHPSQKSDFVDLLLICYQFLLTQLFMKGQFTNHIFILCVVRIFIKQTLWPQCCCFNHTSSKSILETLYNHIFYKLNISMISVPLLRYHLIFEKIVLNICARCLCWNYFANILFILYFYLLWCFSKDIGIYRDIINIIYFNVGKLFFGILLPFQNNTN